MKELSKTQLVKWLENSNETELSNKIFSDDIKISIGPISNKTFKNCCFKGEVEIVASQTGNLLFDSCKFDNPCSFFLKEISNSLSFFECTFLSVRIRNSKNRNTKSIH